MTLKSDLRLNATAYRGSRCRRPDQHFMVRRHPLNPERKNLSASRIHLAARQNWFDRRTDMEFSIVDFDSCTGLVVVEMNEGVEQRYSLSKLRAAIEHGNIVEVFSQKPQKNAGKIQRSSERKENP